MTTTVDAPTPIRPTSEDAPVQAPKARRNGRRNGAHAPSQDATILTGGFPVPTESRFGSGQFVDSPEVAGVAADLLRKHDSLRHLRDLDIRYWWRKKGGERKGKSHLGDTLKPSGPLRFALDGATFLIWLAADHLEGWDAQRIEPLLFHQLLRCGVDENGDPYKAAPDFEGFVEELRAYGPWQADLRLAVKTVRQLPLDVALQAEDEIESLPAPSETEPSEA